MFHSGCSALHGLNPNLKSKKNKACKGTGVIKKLQNKLPRQSLFTIHTSFIRLNLDYEDAVYGQAHNESFCLKRGSVHYNAALAITGALCGTSQTKLYVELGLESLKARQ